MLRFNSKQELSEYLRTKRLREVGYGSEGVCYKADDGLAYKMFSDDSFAFQIGGEYNPKDIITINDINLESFCFPKDLIFVKDKLKGYTSKFVSNNVFNPEIFDLKINYPRLLKAYSKMRKDVDKLSENKIVMLDLSYNLLFDNSKLYGIDTCGYYKSDRKDIKEKNIELLNNAIKDSLEELYYEKIMNEELDKKEYDVISYIDEIKRISKPKKLVKVR